MSSMNFYSACFYFFVFSSISKTQADFFDIDDLVAQSANLLSEYGSYKAPTNNDAYFENMTSSEAIGEVIKL